MNDEKTTEIEVPPRPLVNNIVRVNFTERRKPRRTPVHPARSHLPVIPFAASREWVNPWWVRLTALLLLIGLSLLVL